MTVATHVPRLRHASSRREMSRPGGVTEGKQDSA
jgi:hypothetical protein